MGLFKHILVPTDFGEPSQRAVELALELAKTHGAELTVMHTCEFPTYAYEGMGAFPTDLLTPIEELARKKLDELVSSLSQRGASPEGVLKLGTPWQEILHAIQETRADLVVMGTHGRRGVAHALLGSVAEKLVRMSPVPVLTVRAQ
ncbi:MAG TPA: universal stress protein [Anaeromyxobacteraceae bacterium]